MKWNCTLPWPYGVLHRLDLSPYEWLLNSSDEERTLMIADPELGGASVPVNVGWSNAVFNIEQRSWE